jgi:hypothetical protein
VAALADRGSDPAPVAVTGSPAALPSGGASPATLRFIDEVEGVVRLSARATVAFPETISTIRNGTADFTGALDALNQAAGAHVAALDAAAGIALSDPATRQAHGLLVGAVEASLRADRAWLAVMDFYATEEVREFSTAVAGADRLTAQALRAKQRFLAAYAVLRGNAGRPALGVEDF